MPKALVEIYLPYAQQSFDVAVPEDMPVRQAAPLVAKALAEVSGGLYAPDESAMLCRREDGAPLNVDMTLTQQGIQTGASLVLI